MNAARVHTRNRRRPTLTVVEGGAGKAPAPSTEERSGVYTAAYEALCLRHAPAVAAVLADELVRRRTGRPT